MVSVVSIYDMYLGGMFICLNFPPLISSLVNHLWYSHVFGAHDRNRGTSITNRVLYSSDMCSCRAFLIN